MDISRLGLGPDDFSVEAVRTEITAIIQIRLDIGKHVGVGTSTRIFRATPPCTAGRLAKCIGARQIIGIGYGAIDEPKGKSGSHIPHDSSYNRPAERRVVEIILRPICGGAVGEVCRPCPCVLGESFPVGSTEHKFIGEHNFGTTMGNKRVIGCRRSSINRVSCPCIARVGIVGKSERQIGVNSTRVSIGHQVGCGDIGSRDGAGQNEGVVAGDTQIEIVIEPVGVRVRAG